MNTTLLNQTLTQLSETLTQAQLLLPQTTQLVDWTAHAYVWQVHNRRNGRGFLQALHHPRLQELDDLLSIDRQKQAECKTPSILCADCLRTMCCSRARAARVSPHSFARVWRNLLTRDCVWSRWRVKTCMTCPKSSICCAIALSVLLCFVMT